LRVGETQAQAMAITKSWEHRAVATLDAPEGLVPEERRRELPWLIGASLIILAGLLMTGFAKTVNFPEQEARLARGELLNLNTVDDPEQLLPFLIVFPNLEERRSAAEKIWTALERSKPLP